MENYHKNTFLHDAYTSPLQNGIPLQHLCNGGKSQSSIGRTHTEMRPQSYAAASSPRRVLPLPLELANDNGFSKKCDSIPTPSKREQSSIPSKKVGLPGGHEVVKDPLPWGELSTVDTKPTVSGIAKPITQKFSSSNNFSKSRVRKPSWIVIPACVTYGKDAEVEKKEDPMKKAGGSHITTQGCCAVAGVLSGADYVRDGELFRVLDGLGLDTASPTSPHHVCVTRNRRGGDGLGGKLGAQKTFPTYAHNPASTPSSYEMQTLSTDPSCSQREKLSHHESLSILDTLYSQEGSDSENEATQLYRLLVARTLQLHKGGNPLMDQTDAPANRGGKRTKESCHRALHVDSDGEAARPQSPHGHLGVAARRYPNVTQSDGDAGKDSHCSSQVLSWFFDSHNLMHPSSSSSIDSVHTEVAPHNTQACSKKSSLRPLSAKKMEQRVAFENTLPRGFGRGDVDIYGRPLTRQRIPQDALDLFPVDTFNSHFRCTQESLRPPGLSPAIDTRPCPERLPVHTDLQHADRSLCSYEYEAPLIPKPETQRASHRRRRKSCAPGKNRKNPSKKDKQSSCSLVALPPDSLPISESNSIVPSSIPPPSTPPSSLNHSKKPSGGMVDHHANLPARTSRHLRSSLHHRSSVVSSSKRVATARGSNINASTERPGSNERECGEVYDEPGVDARCQHLRSVNYESLFMHPDEEYALSEFPCRSNTANIPLIVFGDCRSGGYDDDDSDDYTHNDSEWRRGREKKGILPSKEQSVAREDFDSLLLASPIPSRSSSPPSSVVSAASQNVMRHYEALEYKSAFPVCNKR